MKMIKVLLLLGLLVAVAAGIANFTSRDGSDDQAAKRTDDDTVKKEVPALEERFGYTGQMVDP